MKKERVTPSHLILVSILHLIIFSIIPVTYGFHDDGCTENNGTAKTKTCLSIPGPNCIGRQTCTTGVTYHYEPDNLQIQFQLFSKNPAHYATVGFSSNKLMGDDGIVQCFQKNSGNGPPAVEVAETVGKASVRVASSKLQGQLKNVTTSTVNGILICNFSLPSIFDSGQTKFNFLDTKYFVMLAYGRVDGDRTRKHFENPVVSNEPLNIIEVNNVLQGRHNHVNIPRGYHVLGMIITFVFLMPVGTFISRFYKETWADIRYCKRRLWFMLHIGCMLLAFVISLTAYITMALNFGEGFFFPLSTAVKGFWHNIVGLTALILLLSQCTTHWWHFSNPMWVKLGEWGHYAIGTTCYLTGLANIAFTPELLHSRENVNGCRRLVPIIIWIIIHAFCYIFMSSYITWTDWHLKNGGWRTLFGYPMPISSTEEAPRPFFRKCIFVAFVCICFILTLIITFVAFCENGVKFVSIGSEDI